MIDHEQIVSFMLRLKYSLNIQKPESLTCENIKLPDPKDKTIKFRFAPVCVTKGITTPAAMKMMVTQVAHENRTPFDGVFSSPAARELGEDVRRDMLLAEAQEYGLIADDATDARTIPDDVLRELGLTAQEVGQ
mgnify:CR=1 FL=1